MIYILYFFLGIASVVGIIEIIKTIESFMYKKTCISQAIYLIPIDYNTTDIEYTLKSAIKSLTSGEYCNLTILLFLKNANNQQIDECITLEKQYSYVHICNKEELPNYL